MSTETMRGMDYDTVGPSWAELPELKRNVGYLPLDFDLEAVYEVHQTELLRMIARFFRASDRDFVEVFVSKATKYGVLKIVVDNGVEQAVVSPAAISIRAGQAGCSCQGRTAHTG